MGGIAFCSLWTTGPDTTLDSVFRLLAMRAGEAGEAGAWRVFDETCDPFPSEQDASATATARMAREYGVTRAELAGAREAKDAWRAFVEFVGDGPVVVPDGEAFVTWWEHLSGAVGSAPACIGLDELASLFTPGRLAGRRGALVKALLPSASGPPRAIHPPELQAALGELTRRVLARDPRVLEVLAFGLGRAWSELRATDERAAERLALALTLLERPSAWAGASNDLFPAAGELADGALSEAAAAAGREPPALEDLQPRCAVVYEDWGGFSTVPPYSEAPTPFDAADERLLDDLFRVHLPGQFRDDQPGAPDDFYRASQHAVATEVARTLGAPELLLVHAPTGTGKTLAYLLPAMLWARRNNVRVGVATYTRALQEQAMERDVPRALGALHRAGAGDGIRVTVLKGRENYLCWRALCSLAPAVDEDAETWLAWSSLALFALTDEHGDLDQFPLRPPVRLASSKRYRKLLATFVRHVRAQTGCCTRESDRETCAAEVARRRAERSHVVLTNQSFALARQDFFKHIIFDECEHLHDQAHSAWSHRLSFQAARDVLGRMHAPRRGTSRAPLDRLARQLQPTTRPRASLDDCLRAWESTAHAFSELETATGVFEGWRQRASRSRTERDEHSLLREYVESGDAEELLLARRRVTANGNELDASLAELAEHLDQMIGGGRTVRRGLDLARSDLADVLAAVDSWLPLQDGQAAFRPETFYDVETNARGEHVLAARVLLPNEYLGRNYYPGLRNGVFLSATTWLGGGFEAAKGYLGLDRAAEPAEDEERVGCTVRTFRSPEVFDYGRVLVGVPRDAPSFARDKRAFLAYVRKFIAFLGERTRGRMLVLFTNAMDVKQVGEELRGFFRARNIPLWYQGMEEAGKEELAGLFRSHVDSILLGVDTFWFGADFPGETLQYLVIVKLPYGVPDRYHHAQCAALGADDQRRRIYLPRSLAKFRQGFGRLMRKTTDRGCVFILDGRVLEPRHRMFLRELPLAQGPVSGAADGGAADSETAAKFVRGDTDHCVQAALAHMDMLSDVRRRGLTSTFGGGSAESLVRETPVEMGPPSHSGPWVDGGESSPRRRPEPPPFDIPVEDLPY